MIDRLLPRSAARIGAAVVALVLAATVLAACGDDAPGDAAPDPSAVEDTAPTATDSGATSSSSAPATTEAAVDCPAPGGVLTQFTSQVITVVAPDGDDTVDRCVVVAADRIRRSSGLMEVRQLEPFDGMLFAYAQPSSSGYWMRNTPLPLSIAWIDGTGEVVATADMEPCMDETGPCPTYPPNAEFLWALEVPQGELDEFGLVEGATLDVSSLPVGLD